MSCSVWNKIKLGECAVFKNGKKINEDKRLINGMYKIFGSNGVIGNTNEYLIKDESIIIGRVGAYCGAIEYANESSWVTDNAISCVNKENANLIFLYYLLTTLPLREMAGGSAQPLINQSILNNIEVTLPPIQEQQKIASILKSIDNKIELNNEMNKTLEEMAQALFKRWFVDFEFPNEDGEPYKSSGGEMVESEFGVIPNGWKVEALDNFADFKYGKMPKKQLISVQGYPIFSGYKVSGYYNEYMFDNPQLIVVARGVGGTGDVKFTPPMCYLTNLSIAILSNDKSFDEYLYYYLRKANLRNLDTGSAQSQITINDLKRYKILMPDSKVIIKFHKVITTFIEQQRQIENENYDMEILRDSLLPKLMSGEIRVEDIEANL